MEVWSTNYRLFPIFAKSFIVILLRCQWRRNGCGHEWLQELFPTLSHLLRRDQQRVTHLIAMWWSWNVWRWRLKIFEVEMLLILFQAIFDFDKVFLSDTGGNLSTHRTITTYRWITETLDCLTSKKRLIYIYIMMIIPPFIRVGYFIRDKPSEWRHWSVENSNQRESSGRVWWFDGWVVYSRAFWSLNLYLRPGTSSYFRCRMGKFPSWRPGCWDIYQGEDVLHINMCHVWGNPR